MVGENLLSVCLLEKFSKLCFDAKGTHVQCAGFEATHDYGGWQAIGLFKCLDHRAHFLTYLNAILAIWFQSLVWIGFFLAVVFRDSVAIIFIIDIITDLLSMSLQPRHWFQNTSVLFLQVRFLPLSFKYFLLLSALC